MRTKTGVSPSAALQHEKMILAVEETASSSECGSSRAAFLRLASACLYGSAPQGAFYTPNKRG